MLDRRAHARGLMAWIDGDERHQGGPREVLGGSALRPRGIALLGGLEDPGVLGPDEPHPMGELTTAAHVQQPVAPGVVPELLHTAAEEDGAKIVASLSMGMAIDVAVPPGRERT